MAAKRRAPGRRRKQRADTKPRAARVVRLWGGSDYEHELRREYLEAGIDAAARFSVLWRKGYQATGNGLFAWKAYRAARDVGKAPPRWVTGYFDRVADDVIGVFARYRPKAKQAVAPPAAPSLQEALLNPARVLAYTDGANALNAKKVDACVVKAFFGSGLRGRAGIGKAQKQYDDFLRTALLAFRVRQAMDREGWSKTRAVKVTARETGLQESAVWKALH